MKLFLDNENSYAATITVKGKGENEWYIQVFYVEAENFEQAVENVEKELDI